MYRYSASSNQFTFRSNAPLSDDQIARHAPSVMAPAAHQSRSDRYTYVPTLHVLDKLRSEGFQPFEVRQTKVQDAARRDFTKHMLRLRQVGQIDAQGTVPEIVLLNSHDGTSSYQLMAGFFRMVCSNGLIAGDIADVVKVRHSGNVADDVIDGCITVVDNIKHAQERIELYKAIGLTRDQQHEFAQKAIGMRWGEQAPVSASRLLSVRRWDDREPTLWNTLNVVQENLIKGGLSGRATTGRRTTTRGVTSVTEDIKINRELWNLADELAIA